jgi:hypothetical protein
LGLKRKGFHSGEGGGSLGNGSFGSFKKQRDFPQEKGWGVWGMGVLGLLKKKGISLQRRGR